MGEAFDGVNAFCWAAVADAGASPDSAQDCIYMMHAADWLALKAAWRNRPARWREGCAYILGMGPFAECLPLLEQALWDEDSDVSSQAAIGFAGLVLEQDPMPNVADKTRSRLAEVVASHGPAHLEEVVRLLAALSGGEGTPPD